MINYRYLVASLIVVLSFTLIYIFIRSGWVQNEYSNGNIKEEYFVFCGYTHGLYRSYAPDGSLTEELNYKLGKQHGDSRTFHKNGNVHKKMYFNNGDLMGEYEIYFESGNLEEKGDINGGMRSFYENGTIKSSGTLVDGLLDGEAYLYDSTGELEHVRYYEKTSLKIDVEIKDSLKIYSDFDKKVSIALPSNWSITDDTNDANFIIKSGNVESIENDNYTEWMILSYTNKEGSFNKEQYVRELFDPSNNTRVEGFDLLTIQDELDISQRNVTVALLTANINNSDYRIYTKLIYGNQKIFVVSFYSPAIIFENHGELYDDISSSLRFINKKTNIEI